MQQQEQSQKQNHEAYKNPGGNSGFTTAAKMAASGIDDQKKMVSVLKFSI